MLEDTGDEL
jgi:hypothetical protein